MRNSVSPRAVLGLHPVGFAVETTEGRRTRFCRRAGLRAAEPHHSNRMWRDAPRYLATAFGKGTRCNCTVTVQPPWSDDNNEKPSHLRQRRGLLRGRTWSQTDLASTTQPLAPSISAAARAHTFPLSHPAHPAGPAPTGPPRRRRLVWGWGRALGALWKETHRRRGYDVQSRLGRALEGRTRFSCSKE